MLRSIVLAFCLTNASFSSVASGQQISDNKTISRDKELQTGTQEEASEIIVIGLKEPFVLTGQQLQNIIAAFVQARPRYAPAARLAVEVKDIGQGIQADTQFTLVGTNAEYSLLNEGGRFYFPDDLREGQYQSLTANVKRGGVGISLWVMSPSNSDSRRSMGDLRLQCDVMWAASKQLANPLVRTMFVAAGACKSSKIAFYFRSARPIAAGEVTYDGQRIPLQIGRNRLAYRAPIYNAKIPNEATVTLTFE